MSELLPSSSVNAKTDDEFSPELSEAEISDLLRHIADYNNINLYKEVVPPQDPKFHFYKYTDKNILQPNKVERLREPIIILRENLIIFKKTAKEELTKWNKLKWEVDRIDNLLAHGFFAKEAFGRHLILAEWIRQNNNVKERIPCFVKILLRTGETFNNHIVAMNELLSITKIGVHENVLELYGVDIKDPILLISEYCPKRLKECLKEKRLTDYQLLEYAIQIANGMFFLDSNNIIHGNLQANKILVTNDDKIVKISDFGYAQICSKEKARAQISQRDDILEFLTVHIATNCTNCEEQIKLEEWWLSPEVTHMDNYSRNSDVWSYGVTLWEMFSYGEEPHKIVTLTSEGQYLTSPTCSDQIYEVMKRCWFQTLGKMHEKKGYTVPPIHQKHPVEKLDFSKILELLIACMENIYDVDDPYVIDWNSIKIGQQIGRGNFRKVYEATWTRSYSLITNPLDVTCVVKMPFYDDAIRNKETSADTRNEVTNMLKIKKHENIVRLYGIVLKPLYMVFEFCDGGLLYNKLEQLRKNKQQTLFIDTLKDYANQIRCGMEYLAKMGFVHRDIAVRNIMLAKNDKIAKVADFGLARFKDLMSNKKALYYSPAPDSIENVHVFWMAPEIFDSDVCVYTEKSDVWSYGILLWEMFSYARVLYSDIKEALRIVKEIKTNHSEDRLIKPRHCPDDVYNLMLQCWQEDPEDRPHFKNIKFG